MFAVNTPNRKKKRKDGSCGDMGVVETTVSAGCMFIFLYHIGLATSGGYHLTRLSYLYLIDWEADLTF